MNQGLHARALLAPVGAVIARRYRSNAAAGSLALMVDASGMTDGRRHAPLMSNRSPGTDDCGRATQIASLVAVIGVHILLVLGLLSSGSDRAANAAATLLLISMVPDDGPTLTTPSPRSEPTPPRSPPSNASPSIAPRRASVARQISPAPAIETMRSDARTERLSAVLPGPAASASEHTVPATQSPSDEVVDGSTGGAATAATDLAFGRASRATQGAIVEAAPRLISAAGYSRAPVLDYPSVSRRFGEEGRVVLRVLIGPDGAAQEVRIEQSSGYARLDQAALKAAAAALYRPHVEDGLARLSWALVPLNFALKGQDQ